VSEVVWTAATTQARLDRNPFSRLLQLRAVTVREEFAELELPVTEQVSQMLGLVHGGAVATLIDSACAACLWPHLEAQGVAAVTLEMKVNFLATPRGAFARAQASLLRFGRTTAYTECSVTDESGKLCARASATFFLLRGEAPA